MIRNTKDKEIAKALRKAARAIELERVKNEGRIRSKSWNTKKTSKEERRKIKEKLKKADINKYSDEE